jgi:hypothetical protein
VYFNAKLFNPQLSVVHSFLGHIINSFWDFCSNIAFAGRSLLVYSVYGTAVKSVSTHSAHTEALSSATEE